MMVSKRALMEIAMCLVFVLLIFVARAGELHFIEGLAGAAALREAINEATSLGMIFALGVVLVLVMVFLGGGFSKKK